MSLAKLHAGQPIGCVPRILGSRPTATRQKYISLVRWYVVLVNLKDNLMLIYYVFQIYRDMFDSYDELKELKDAAEILASVDDWPALYDEAQLAKNKVPVYAATYVDDMFVHYDLATATAKKIKGAKQFITNTMFHGALRDRTDEVMRQLFFLKEDSID
jgi:proline iminopeptidase